ncbi:MAG: selenide, water dikinase SelD [Planctomycetaceae bacterium]|nr:selenide, water dikinase SelD [Planctomycetaceae bacterium]
MTVKDMEKRRRVMARSMQLGHCICDPKKSCPCDIFRQQDLCPCAGEQPTPPAGPAKLTDLVHRPGCASKIDARSLKRILTGLPSIDDPRVLVGMPAADDAGVYQLDEDQALVQTVDVFSPSVDDPYTFGQIAAANSVSDVYAMGGRPITALSIVGFPVGSVADDVLHEILRGGIDKMKEAEVAVIGGHSINDQEIKAGFAVTGLIHPKKIASNAGLRAADQLVLTKPLGTGVLAFAGQIGRAPDGALEAAARSMARLNREAARLMIECGAHACTDVTGFGLMGHLSAMAAASKADVEVLWDDLPVLPGLLQCLADGIVPGAIERNREASAASLVAGDGLDQAMLDLCFDPQTSGGLLIAVPPENVERLVEQLHESGDVGAAHIGEVRGPGTGQVFVLTSGKRSLPTPRRFKKTKVANDRPASAESPGCCSSAGQEDSTEPVMSEEGSGACCCPQNGVPEDCSGTEELSAGVSETEARFHEFLKSANSPGALGAKTKQAMAIALSVLAKCEPCVKSHVKKARAMGFTQEEIDEAAWMAIAFGGSPLMMFYKALRSSV